MKAKTTSRTRIRGIWLPLLIPCAIIALPSCGKKEDKAPAPSTAAGTPSTRATPDEKKDTPPAPKQAATASPGRPAPPPEKPAPPPEPENINLKKFPMFTGAEPRQANPATLHYAVKGDVAGVFEFQKKEFLARHWRELPASSVTEQSASTMFGGAGQAVSVTVFSLGKPGEVEVMLHHHGSVDLKKLPLPPGTTPVYVGPAAAMHVTEASVADTAEALKKLLTGSGWEPLGGAGDSRYYTKDGNRLTATVSTAPAQGGKTMISYENELLTGEYPVMPGAEDVRYTSSQQKLTFDAPAGPDEIVAFYKEHLARKGWKPTHEKTLRIGDHDEMVFRAEDGQVLFVDIMSDRGGKRPVSLGYLSAQDVRDLDADRAKLIEANKKKAQDAAK